MKRPRRGRIAPSVVLDVALARGARLSPAAAVALAAVLAACGEASPPAGGGAAAPAAAVLEVVARDVVGRVPAEVPDGTPRFVAPWWGGDDPPGPVPEAVLATLRAATALPVAPGDGSGPPSPPAALLSLFRPVAAGPDAWAVTAEWLHFPAGAPTFSGVAYRYLVRCEAECRVERRTGPAALNE